MTNHKESAELISEIAAMRKELLALRGEVKDLRSVQVEQRPVLPSMPERAETPVASRRQLLRRGAVAAGVGVAGAALAARPVAAADGGPALIGANNIGTGTTRVTTSGVGSDALSGVSTALSGQSWGVSGSSSSPDGIGVNGSSDSTTGFATGVRGRASSVIGTGVSAEALSAAGATTGVKGVVSSPDGVGVFGINRATAGEAVAVLGESSSPVGIGVHGRVIPTNGSGIGVLGECDSTAGTAVVAQASEGTGLAAVADNGIGGAFSGTQASLLLVSSGAAPAGRTELHVPGEIYFDDNADLWVCTAIGIPGTWKKLNSGLTPVDPFRVYDSRFADGPLVKGANRVVSVKNSIDTKTGATLLTDAVPAGATAVSFNLTVAGTAGSGFMSTAPGNATTAGSSSINWRTSGAAIANGTMVKLDANRQLKAFVDGASGASTNFIVDITGYIA